MKKETFRKTREAIALLSEVLTSYEYGEAHTERLELLKAFNVLTDLVVKPRDKANPKRILSFLGSFYFYFNEYNEFVLLDSDKRQIAFFEDVDDKKEYDLIKQLEAISNPMELLDLGFCAELYYDNDMRNFVKLLKKYDLFETSNPQSEIFRIGDYFMFFVY
jgi:hypothetical protein